jgi:formylglycine-generating enzyme required for sulfatase activity
VELNDLEEHEIDGLGRLEPGAVSRLLCSRLASEGVVVDVDDIDRLSSTGRAVWLLDGLNEISGPDLREAVVEAIAGYVRRWRNSRFIVTTTEAALAAHGTPRGLTRVDIDSIREGDVETFLEAFASEFFPRLPQDQRLERWQPLATKILSSADLQDLARTPLQLTAIAMIYFTEGWLPESRADLLQATVTWSIRKRVPVLRSFVRRGRDLQLLLEELAYQMVAEGEQPLLKVGKRWAAEQLATAQVAAFDGSLETSLDFLNAVTSAGGLVVPRGPGDVGMHEAVRNYLAASYVAGKTDDERTGWWHMLEPHVDDHEWRHILMLVPGCLLGLGSARVDLFFDRLGKSCISQGRDVRATRVALGGSVLRELTLAGYRLGDVPHWHEAVRTLKELFYVVTDLEPEVRRAAAVAYGLTGDDRFDDLNGGWAWLDGGQFWMGSQADDPGGRGYDPDAAPWETPVRLVTVPPFAIRKHPVTVQEYQVFVEDGGYSRDDCWSSEALAWRDAARIGAPLEWLDQVLAPNTPVTGVSWFESEAYCRWLSARSEDGALYRLPYEREWEYAAKRGTASDRQFAWGWRMRAGSEAEANWIGAQLRRKSPVGIFPRSNTQDGVADLFGNVEEWCLDLWEDGDGSGSLQLHSSDPLASTAKLAQAVMQNSAARHSAEGIRRVVRGGSCIRFSRLCRPTYRSRIAEHHRYLTVGFRLIRQSAPPSVR